MSAAINALNTVVIATNSPERAALPEWMLITIGVLLALCFVGIILIIVDMIRN